MGRFCTPSHFHPYHHLQLLALLPLSPLHPCVSPSCLVDTGSKVEYVEYIVINTKCKNKLQSSYLPIRNPGTLLKLWQTSQIRSTISLISRLKWTTRRMMAGMEMSWNLVSWLLYSLWVPIKIPSHFRWLHWQSGLWMTGRHIKPAAPGEWAAWLRRKYCEWYFGRNLGTVSCTAGKIQWQYWFWHRCRHPSGQHWTPAN